MVLTVDKFVEEIEKNNRFLVLAVYDYDSDNYLACCMNRKTKALIGDFFFMGNKRTGKVASFNPSYNISEFKMPKRREPIYEAKIR